MTFLSDAVCLPDVNVWTAAASDRHEHHATARQWFDSALCPVCFCRVTQMAFLGLLTNPKGHERGGPESGRGDRGFTVNCFPTNACASKQNRAISKTWS